MARLLAATDVSLYDIGELIVGSTGLPADSFGERRRLKVGDVIEAEFRPASTPSGCSF